MKKKWYEFSVWDLKYRWMRSLLTLFAFPPIFILMIAICILAVIVEVCRTIKRESYFYYKEVRDTTKDAMKALFFMNHY